MKCIAAVALFLGATLLTASSAMAQRKAIEVNVPFNFTVNNTFLPAGNYVFGFDSTLSNLLVIRNRKSGVSAEDFGQRGSVSQGRPHAVVFHCYDGQYFLSQVRFDSASEGVNLPATKTEKKARKGNRNEELASITVY